jgi:hypothetical protein
VQRFIVYHLCGVLSLADLTAARECIERTVAKRCQYIAGVIARLAPARCQLLARGPEIV